MAEVYDFEDFFVPRDDQGVEVQVPINGRVVPIRVKRAVNLEDRMAAEAKAVKISVDAKGNIKQEMKQEEGAKEMVFRCILSWPFTQKKRDSQGRVLMDEAGEPLREAVPLTRENVAAFLSDGAMYLYLYLQDRLPKADVLDPFAKPSVDLS